MATGRVPTTANSPLTTKGDLFTYDTSQARLAVGSNGETLVADSSTSTGLRWNPSMAAGKNGVINGAFDIWQRGTSFTTTSGVAYTTDRWSSHTISAGGSVSTTRITVSDTTNLPFIEYATKFQRVASNSNTGILSFFNTFESANSYPYVGKTVTLSFYAKKGANYSAASDILVSDVAYGTGTDQIMYNFTGRTDLTQNNTLTTTWQRFTHTVSIPSTATEIAVNFYYTPVGTAGADDSFSITGVQLELGSTATAFSRAGGTLAGELAACQRYFWKQTGGHNTVYGLGQGQNTENVYAQVNLPVNMRTKTMVLGYSNLRLSDFVAAITPTAIAIYTTTGGAGSVATNNLVQLHCSGLPGNAVAHRPYTLQNADNTAGYLQFDAEL